VVVCSRSRRATSSKLQEKTQLSTSPMPERKNTEIATKLSWDNSSGISENSSPNTQPNSTSHTNFHPEEHPSKYEVTGIKSQHMSLSKSFLQLKSMKEKQLIKKAEAERQKSSVNLLKRPVLGTYRGRVIQSKINSFRKAPSERQSSLPDKKLLSSATQPAVSYLSPSNSTVVLKPLSPFQPLTSCYSIKLNGVLPFQIKPPAKAAVTSQSSVKKCQPPSAAAPKKVPVQNMIGGRGPQPPKAASKSSDCITRGVKKGADSGEAPAKQTSAVYHKKLGQNSKTNGNRKFVLPKESAEERRARLDEWRASRGKVMRRPPISLLMGTQSRAEEQELPSSDSTEKVNKTLMECLQLTEQGCQTGEVQAMLADLTHVIPGAKKLGRYWTCCMRLEQKGPLEKLFAVYDEAVLSGAMPKEELRQILIDKVLSTSHTKPEDVVDGTVIEAHLSEVVEAGKEQNSSVEQVQEPFMDLGCNDEQKSESDKKTESDKKADTSREEMKKEEMDSDLKPREEVLPKKSKKHKSKERSKKRGKSEAEEQNEDGVKDTAQVVLSEKENDTPYSVRYNPSTTPYLESGKMHNETIYSSAKGLKIATPLRYSQRIRKKMHKDADKDPDLCLSSFEHM
ncbi:CKAP2 protein, partial [Alcedo cyanopectus]|nr:CKAP2 protein [Ceyx cyanopectus]